MTWTYSGDPSNSELDLYRFLISDTIESEPVLQDAEINYLLAEHDSKNVRLFHMFQKAADLFAREYKSSLGPSSEDPTSRMNYYAERANHYSKLVTAYGLQIPKPMSPISFRKGMHDNA